MPSQPFATVPVPSPNMPSGIPFIVGNEAAERFSYYGMRAILVTFMTKYLFDSQGTLAPMTDEQAKAVFHTFSWAVYFTPIFGAIIADVFFGKYRTIVSLSIVYCLGHLALALDETRMGLMIGLTLIAMGSGGIKPCVSAHVGDQFGKENKHLVERVFGWFYFAINFGSFFSTLLTPWLLESFPAWLRENLSPETVSRLEPVERIGAHVAFGVPGLLMLIATWVFWLGRYRFVHIPPRGWSEVKVSLAGEGGKALLRLAPVFLCVAVFWSLYDQTASAWVLQADKMDRNWMGVNWSSAQVQAINPILVLAFIPLFSYVIYPAIHHVFPLTPLRKVSIGFFLTFVSFLVPVWIEQQIAYGVKLSISWQVFAYVIITAAEIMVSITCLEFSYTQAPRAVKSLVMAMYLSSVSMGNAFTALINVLIQDEHGKSRLSGADYYWLFSGVMLLTAIGFIFIARSYKGQTYLQE